MTPKQLIQRGRSVVGTGTRYKLGKGGMRPDSVKPADAHGFCDCSGFVCWALGISRQTDHPLYMKFNGGWINTNAMVHDAGEVTGIFKPALVIVPGVILVYPGKGKRVGHCGIVSEMGASPADMKIIHCSSGNSRRGDAIQETGPEVFGNPATIAIWYEGIDGGGAQSASRFG